MRRRYAPPQTSSRLKSTETQPLKRQTQTAAPKWAAYEETRTDKDARREKASALLGRPVAVRFALKNQVSNLGKDPMDALVQFGEQHSDIFTIK